MSAIPNFVSQVQEVERELKTEWNSVQEGWQDSVAEDFNERVMEPYMRNFPQYITGEGISGYGLEQLLQQMEKHIQEMNTLVS